MCDCEQRKFRNRLRPVIAAGDDLVAAIQNAAWGTVRHPTMHMESAIATWKERTCPLLPRKVDA